MEGGNKMKSKGKAVVFSILPGGGHFYLGLYNRGIIFFVSSIILSIGFRNYGYGPFNLFGNLNGLFHSLSLLVWLYSAIDAYMNADYINRGIINLEEEIGFSKRNKDLLGIILSVVPGLGHMYEGYSSKGSKLLVIFIIGELLGGFINIGLINDLLLILSIYSVLDLIALREGRNFGFDLNGTKELNSIFKIAGLILIIFGIAQGFQIASNYLIDFGFNHILNIVSIFSKAAILVIIGIIILYKTSK